MPATQFNMKWVESAGPVKFDFLGLKTLTVIDRAVTLPATGAAPASDVSTAAARRPARLRADVGRPDGRRVPAGRAGHARHPAQAAAHLDRGRHRPGRALPARPDGQHRRLLSTASSAASRSTWLHPLAGAGAGRDLRHHRLPGAGDADRPDPGRLHPGRGRPAAPRHGQEEEGGDGPAAGPLRRRAPRPRASPCDQADDDLRPGGQVRRLRLQQEPRRRLRLHHLPDRLAEGATRRSSSSPPR